MPPTVDEAIAILNDALQAEPEAVRAVFGYHPLPADSLLRDHPTIQVDNDPRNGLQLSALGLLNGIFGTRPDGIGHICGVFESDNEEGPYILMRFERTPLSG